MNENVKELIRVVTSFVVLVLVFILFFVVVLLSSPEPSYFEYSHSEYHPTTKTKTSGIVRTSINLLNDDKNYIAYASDSLGLHESESLVMVKKFGGSEYECHGTCYCEDIDTSDRRSSTTGKKISRGIFVILSAFSAYMATNAATEIFEDECVHQLISTGHCDETTVTSEIEKCEFLFEGEKDEIGTVVKMNGGDRVFGEEPGSYLCSGHCLGNYMQITRPFKDRCERKFKKCRDLNLEKEIEYDDDEYESPEIQFAEDHLFSFCLETTRVHVYPKDHKRLKQVCRVLGGGDEKTPHRMRLTGFARHAFQKCKDKGFPCCHGIHSKSGNGPYDREDSTFHHIKCKFLDGSEYDPRIQS